jgi:transcriptional regulator with XRE-family HTH domain
MKLNEWIKAARLAMGKTQSELGDIVNVGKANVSHWEKGTHQASFDQIIAIAAASGMALPIPPGVRIPPSNISPAAWAIALGIDSIIDQRRRDAAYAMCLANIQALSNLETGETPAQPPALLPAVEQS